MAWPSVRVGLYDSDRWHSPPRWARDGHRAERLRPIGWVLRGVGTPDLLPSETWLRDQLDRLHRRPAA